LDKEIKELREEIDQLKKNTDKREERVIYLKNKCDTAEDRCVDLEDKILQLEKYTEKTDKRIECLRTLRRTVCPTKKYWIDEVNQKHSDKLKEVVKSLGKKHVVKREKIKQERDAFAKRVFELTEMSHKQVVAEPIPECECSALKAQIQSLKLQLATEKRISQKYAKTIQDRASALTAM
jgi:hypothetical protein